MSTCGCLLALWLHALSTSIVRCLMRVSCAYALHLFSVALLARIYRARFWWSNALRVPRKCCSILKREACSLSYSCLDNTCNVIRCCTAVVLPMCRLSAPTTNLRWVFFLTGRSSAQDSSGLDAHARWPGLRQCSVALESLKGLDNLLN